jgi:hypothetical protein
MVKDLAQVVGILLRDQAKSDIGPSEEVRARLETVQRTLQFDPGQLLEKMLEDLHAADSIRANYVALFKGLVGDKQSGRKNEFPRVLDFYDIADSWKKLRTRVSDAFGVATNCTQPMPDHVDIGYIAERIQDLARDGPSHLGALPEVIEQLSPYLKRPHLVQAVTATLLCRWLFAAPESMCKNIYSSKELKMHEAVLRGGELLTPYPEQKRPGTNES